MLLDMVPLVLLSMVALITTYMKESDWLLKNFHQSENGLQSYHEEQNRGYHLKEHKKTVLKTGVKSDVAFCLGSSIEKTISAMGHPIGDRIYHDQIDDQMLRRPDGRPDGSWATRSLQVT